MGGDPCREVQRGMHTILPSTTFFFQVSSNDLVSVLTGVARAEAWAAPELGSEVILLELDVGETGSGVIAPACKQSNEPWLLHAHSAMEIIFIYTAETTP